MTNEVRNFLVAIAAIFAIGCQRHFSSGHQVCFSNHCFDVEVVTSGKKMERGLQFRTSLADKAGMLFAFPSEDRYVFWMKDTLIPLDMIWMDFSQRVVFMAENVPPCKTDSCPVYTPTAKALYVLEINAGTVKKLGLKINDMAVFKINDDGFIR